MKIMLLSIFLGLCYLVVGMYYSLTYNIPVLGAFALMTSPFIMVLLSIKLDDLVDYIGVVKRMFKLFIEHKASNESEIVYVINGYSKNPVPKIETVSKEVYKYNCRGIMYKS